MDFRNFLALFFTLVLLVVVVFVLVDFAAELGGTEVAELGIEGRLGDYDATAFDVVVD